MDKRGHITIFSLNFCLTVPKGNPTVKGILLFLRKFLVSKSFMDEKGVITIFRRNFFLSHSAEKHRKGTL